MIPIRRVFRFHTSEYPSASVHGQWLRWLGLVLPILGITVLVTWLVQAEVITKRAILLAQSSIMSIHREPAMIPIPEGTFRQYNIHSLGRSQELPVREVTINPFALGKFEVTIKEYDRFVVVTGGDFPDDEGWGRGSRPAIYVSWHDAKAYAQWLSKETGKRYRLPTEAEWEYAARSGGKDEIWAGTSDAEQLTEYAVYGENSDGKSAEVGSKEPNGLGLYNMSGNVREWVEDCWHGTYEGAPRDGSAWLEAGDGRCDRHVIRGGSWFDRPDFLQASTRSGSTSVTQTNTLGFRLAQDNP